MTEAVVVGVRVRPFNDREKAMSADVCIEMVEGKTTINQMLKKKVISSSSFTFDQSFWSHDGFEDDGTGYLRPTAGTRYADQRLVFDTFGQRVLDNAWQGYHCCLFAYGQTGAGKSYSMVGTGGNKGIVPVSCDRIFQRIQARASKEANVTYEVSLTMVEIYNETVQDLFVLSEDRPKQGLRIKESRAFGIYIDGAQKRLVSSSGEITRAVDDAMMNRIVAATAMNATSSRAHTVTTIEFKQSLDDAQGNESVKLSMINLVDLAGSEKVSQTSATGTRLKEGIAINKSLTALGNVIERLAERSTAKAKDFLRTAVKAEVLIPYRDSKLTRLLQNALGGSSKTIMICALSPASSNYDETLSTLRYADRAKKIKNQPLVNEDPQEKLLRELREENETLKNLVGKLQVDGSPMDKSAMDQILKHQESTMSLQRLYNQERRPTSEKVRESAENALQLREGVRKRMSVKPGQSLGNRTPQLINLAQDWQLSGKLRFNLPEDQMVRVGNPHAHEGGSMSSGAESAESDGGSELDEPEIALHGDGIRAAHATIMNSEGRCALSCQGPATQLTWINGQLYAELLLARQMKMGRKVSWKDVNVSSPEDSDVPVGLPSVALKHKDRVAFGCSLFVFVDPQESGHWEMMIVSGDVSYSKAAKELPADWKSMVKAHRGQAGWRPHRSTSNESDTEESPGASASLASPWCENCASRADAASKLSADLLAREREVEALRERVEELEREAMWLDKGSIPPAFDFQVNEDMPLSAQIRLLASTLSQGFDEADGKLDRVATAAARRPVAKEAGRYAAPRTL